MINTSRGTGTGAAVYGDITYAFCQKLKLTSGWRYDHEKRKLAVLGEYQKDPDPNPMYAYRTYTSATAGFSALPPKIALAFYPSVQQSFYITYTRGFRAGGLTPLSSDPSQLPLYPFKPEYSNSMEAGWKQSLRNQKLIINLALFYTTVNHVQVPTLVLPDAVTITRNTGKLISKGVESELSASLLKGFLVEYNFGYTHARYNRLKLSQNGNETDLKGRHQVFTPDVTSMLAAEFTRSITRNSSFIIRGEWKYLGTEYFDPANAIQQPSYHLLNTRFGVAFKKIKWMLWGRNLTNKHYISYAYDFGAVHLGDPRTLGMDLGIKF